MMCQFLRKDQSDCEREASGIPPPTKRSKISTINQLKSELAKKDEIIANQQNQINDINNSSMAKINHLEGVINILRNGMTKLSDECKGMEQNFEVAKKDTIISNEKCENLRKSWLEEIRLNQELEKKLDEFNKRGGNGSNEITKSKVKVNAKRNNNKIKKSKIVSKKDNNKNGLNKHSIESNNKFEKDAQQYGLHRYSTRKNIKHIESMKFNKEKK